jgi:hypothetical protein
MHRRGMTVTLVGGRMVVFVYDADDPAQAKGCDARPHPSSGSGAAGRGISDFSADLRAAPPR